MGTRVIPNASPREAEEPAPLPCGWALPILPPARSVQCRKGLSMIPNPSAC